MHASELVQEEHADSYCKDRNWVWIGDHRELSNRGGGRRTGKRRRSREEGKRSCERKMRNLRPKKNGKRELVSVFIKTTCGTHLRKKTGM